jgi:hypothetical protein
MNFLLVIVICEHLFFFLQYILQELISTVPAWVEKNEVRVSKVIEEMAHEQKEIK